MSAYGTFRAGPAPAGFTPDYVASSDAPFTLSDLLRVLRERRRLILRVAASVVALTVIAVLFLPTMYSATAVVMLDQRKNAVADASAVLSNLPTDAASMQNQIQILTSRDLAGTVTDKFGLERDPEFNPTRANGVLSPFADLRSLINPLKWFAPRPVPGSVAAAAATRAAVIDNVLHHLSVDTVGLSTSIAVRFAANNPQKAARIANAFADAYVAQQVKIKSDAASQATKWLTARVDQLSDQVQSAETAVEKYKAEHNLSEAADGTSLVDQQLAAINTQLVQARADLAAKDAAYGRVKDLVASGHLADVSQAVSSPLIVQLRTQEALLLQQQADMATRYGPRHPKMIAVKSQIHDLDAKLAQEVDRIAGSLANDMAVARAQVGSLNASLQATEREAAQQNIATVKLKALQADAASTRAMYESFVTRLRQTQDQDAIQMSDARVISPAPVPSAPASPHRLLIVVASIPAGLLLGLMAALLAERYGLALPTSPRMFPGPVVAPRKIVPAVSPSVPVLARIPDAGSVRAIDYVIDRPASNFAQGIGRLMRAIAEPANGTRARIVAVTALGPEEGKTAISLGLARMAARAGWKVIVVDGDLMRAPVARTLGHKTVENGLAEVVHGRAPLSRCFLHDPRSPVLALSGTMPTDEANATVLSPVLSRLFAHLRLAADLVIIDATPLAAIRETEALVRHADAVVLAVDPRRSPEQSVQAAAHALIAMQAPPVGIVLVA